MTLKKQVKRILMRSGAMRIAGSLSGKKVVILRYHSIQEDRTKNAAILPDSIVHTAREFEQHVSLVAREYDPVTMDEILDFVRNGSKLPRRPVAFTFDDGFMDNLEMAVPILEKYGLRGAFYVISGNLDSDRLPWFCRTNFAFEATRERYWNEYGQNVVHDLTNMTARNEARRAANRICASQVGDEQMRIVQAIESDLGVAAPVTKRSLMMEWDHARQVQRLGHIVGSHTVSHPTVTQLSQKQLDAELGDSKSRISEELGCEIEHFSYPNPIIQPHWNADSIIALKKIGYGTGVVSTSGPVQLHDIEPFALTRIPAARDAAQFRWNLEASFAGIII